MDILINELSLHSQFNNETDFFDSLKENLKIIKLIEVLSFNLLKKYDFYSYNVTDKLDLNSIIKIKGNDEVTRFKSLLSRLINDPPYWENEQKHSSSDEYICTQTELTSGYSIAEACERDKTIMSFKSDKFLDEVISVLKNGENHEIYNSIKKYSFLDYLYNNEKISEIDYCKYRFDSNLDFSNLDNEEFGFEILEDSETKNFIGTFKKFSEMSWENISKDDGLQYKPYNASDKENIFKNTKFFGKNIYKFRTSQKYRCFGYRENDKFYVLRFETDHKASDKG